MVSAAIALSEYLAETLPNLKAVVFATNARAGLHPSLRDQWPHVTFVGTARKPWRISYVVDVPRPIVVLGDQIVTDGLLAFRLHGQFLHWRGHGRVPWWPRLQRIIGELLVRLMFSPMHYDPSASNQVRSAQ
jgi:hypothetical protein